MFQTKIRCEKQPRRERIKFTTFGYSLAFRTPPLPPFFSRQKKYKSRAFISRRTTQSHQDTPGILAPGYASQHRRA